MSDFFDFAGKHWFLAIFMILFVCGVLRLVVYSFMRLCRLLVVLVRGWPPAHLDADGNWKPEPKKDGE